MDNGFDTIGNAILIAYDRGKSVLVTDPWLSDSSYFGSWGRSHEIPDQQTEAIYTAPYIWISHGHPDHLDSGSLKKLSNKKILLPDHVGGRIARDLKEQGYDTSIMESRRWYSLSDGIRILCISDLNQDAILLVEINGRLIINQNDAADYGWGARVRHIAKRYRKSYLLALSGLYSEADMINFFDEDGQRIPPSQPSFLLGKNNAFRAQAIGADAFVPFSSMHCYRRTDSIWANAYRTGLSDYQIGFESDRVEGLPPYVRCDCTTDIYTPINPAPMPAVVRDPKEFGDDWDEVLNPQDIRTAIDYFRSVEHLGTFLDYINLRVGKKDNFIKIADHHRYRRGITFEAPRKSLMTTITYHIFDDMLIGNFMKTTLHGKWGRRRLLNTT